MNRIACQSTMKTTHSIPYLLLAALLTSVCPGKAAETPSGLSLQTYAGLTITGAVGRVYTVQYTTNVGQSNDWRGAGMLQLPSTPYLWVDTTAPATGRRFYRAVEGPTNMVWIRAGTFTMGSPSNELERADSEGPQTVVTLTHGFFMGKHEVTQWEYKAVIGTNPSYFRNGVGGRNLGGVGTTITNETSYPVEQVSWIDATNYCGVLTARELASGRLPAGWVYRRPTEAEWEYACRAGGTSAFHYGPALRSGIANFDARNEYDSLVGTTNNSDGIYLGRTTEVGSYEANGWGLYDMHGNVWEWCSDWFICSDTRCSGLPGGRVIDPQGPSGDFFRVIRGGSWDSGGGGCRSASRGRNSSDPGNRYYGHGFRAVLSPGQP